MGFRGKPGPDWLPLTGLWTGRNLSPGEWKVVKPYDLLSSSQSHSAGKQSANDLEVRNITITLISRYFNLSGVSPPAAAAAAAIELIYCVICPLCGNI